MTDVEEAAPCPFCGGPPRTFHYNGALQASCASSHTECAGTDVAAPVAMWNRRPSKAEPIAYLRVYPKDGSRFLAFAASTGPLPPVQTMDNGTIIQNTPLYA